MEARVKAVEEAIAASASRLSMQFAKDLLGGSTTASTWSYGPDPNVSLGDFTATLTGACGTGTTKASTVLITAVPVWYASYVSDAGGSVSISYGICFKD